MDITPPHTRSDVAVDFGSFDDTEVVIVPVTKAGRSWLEDQFGSGVLWITALKSALPDVYDSAHKAGVTIS